MMFALAFTNSSIGYSTILAWDYELFEPCMLEHEFFIIDAF